MLELFIFNGDILPIKDFDEIAPWLVHRVNAVSLTSRCVSSISLAIENYLVWGGDITETHTLISKPSHTSKQSRTTNFHYLLIKLGKIIWWTALAETVSLFWIYWNISTVLVVHSNEKGDPKKFILKIFPSFMSRLQ